MRFDGAINYVAFSPMMISKQINLISNDLILKIRAR